MIVNRPARPMLGHTIASVGAEFIYRLLERSASCRFATDRVMVATNRRVTVESRRQEGAGVTALSLFPLLMQIMKNKFSVRQLAQPKRTRTILTVAVVWCIGFVVAGVLTGPVAQAQNGDLRSLFPKASGRSFRFGANQARKQQLRETKWSALYSVNPDGETGILKVSVKITKPYHISSVTQAKGGPLPTVIKIGESSGVKATGDFVPSEPPLRSESAVFKGVIVEEHEGEVFWTAPISLPAGFDGKLSVTVSALACETVHGSCTRVNETFVAARSDTAIVGNVETSAPTGSRLAADAGNESKMVGKAFRDGDYVVQWRAQVEPASVAPGGRAVLKFVAEPDAKFHVYRGVTDNSESSTNFVVTQKSGLKVGAPVDAKPPISHSILPGTDPVHYYVGKATWSLPIQVPADAAAGPHAIEGQIAYQACTDSACYRPMALKFTANVNVGQAGGAIGEVTLVPAKYAATLDLAAETKWVDSEVKLGTQASIAAPAANDTKTVAVPAVAPHGNSFAGPPVPTGASVAISLAPSDVVSPTTDSNLSDNLPGNKAAAARFDLSQLQVKPKTQQSAAKILPLAFVAGFLLNFMPCVLPVVGLKLLSFVQQANSDRRRIFLMNLAYTAGLLSVMMVLATMAVFAGLGWGEQFSSTKFTVTLAAIVFAFGLSFLGVWEIPLPGFVGDADSGSKQEGYGGAFTKGILSTLLATPCSGPFLGAALAWAVTQSGWVTYSVFFMVGLGMASPYLVIGLFPSLIRFLPKPGNWMVMFKQIMGFVMLGTVVYLMSFMPVSAVVPCTLLFLGVGVAVWWAAQTPIYAPAKEQVRAWSIAGGLIVATALLSFGWLQGVMQSRFEAAAQRWFESVAVDSNVQLVSAEHADDEIPWQTFSPDKLQQAVSEGKPVFVDFTADWCVTCKANEAAAIDTPEVARALRAGEVIALRADKTEPNPAADQLLSQLGNSARAIPFYAFFPVDDPKNPITLDGVYPNSGPFLAAIDKAVGKR